MAWTSPKTYVAGNVLTASEMNTYQRDNMNETATAKVSAAGDIVYADAANSLVRLAAGDEGDSLSVSSGGVPVYRRRPFAFIYGLKNVAASLSSNVLTPGMESSFLTMGVAVPWDFRIVGAAVHSSEARTAGTATLSIQARDIATFSTVHTTFGTLTLDGTNTRGDSLKAGDAGATVTSVTGPAVVTVLITTDSSWLPTSADIAASVYVEADE